LPRLVQQALSYILRRPGASLASLDAACSRDELLPAIGLKLSGYGVEFGAGASPFPIGPSCRVCYADRNSNDRLRERQYFKEGTLVEQNLVSDIETMEGISPESLDFIIASHVIEHTPNPLRALRSAYEKLKPGGRLVLVVPEQTATFDRGRALTTIEHLLTDYAHPSRERDWEHYIEFFSKSFPQPDPAATARGPFELGDDIHFHVWTFESFTELIAYVCRNMDPWSSVWSRPRMSPQDIEFYFILTK
jgi:SAM-dependent methyltransferase